MFLQILNLLKKTDIAGSVQKELNQMNVKNNFVRV